MIIKAFTVDETSPYLTYVKRLWHSHLSTLGYFPDSAFIYFAQKGRIIGALDSDENFIGYLMYRLFPMQGKATVLHICVDSLFRRKGASRVLIDHLIEKTKWLQGISLLSRGNQDEESIWSRLGFTAIDKANHRSWDGKPLTLWWYDHNLTVLLPKKEFLKNHEKLRMAFDIEVLYALQDKQGSKQDNSQALLADWLQESIILCITDEAFHAINRHVDRLEQEFRRAFARKFYRIGTDESTVRAINRQLDGIFAFSISDNNESARLNLSGAIAAAASCFVTNNIMILNQAESVYDAFGISILSPLDLILQLNELIRESEYQPFRLQGTQVHKVLTHNEKSSMLLSLSKGETYKTKIDRALQENPNEDTWTLKDINNRPLALITCARDDSGILEISTLKLQKGSLLPTLARFCLHLAIQIAYSEEATLIRFTESQLSAQSALALHEHGFVPTSRRGWAKCCLHLTEASHTVIEKLESLSHEFRKDREFFQHIMNTLQTALYRNDILSIYELERALWPLKITDLEIPSFIISIKPDWAMSLLDYRLTHETLFQSAPEFTMKCENAYIQPSRPKSLKSPGRILWYVTQGRVQGSMHIRASSYLDETVTDRPESLFRQFHRLGVYTWQNINNIAKDDRTIELTALRFSGTELLRKPVGLNEVQQILKEETGKTPKLMSPFQIPAQCFFRLYRIATEAPKRNERNRYCVKP